MVADFSHFLVSCSFANMSNASVKHGERRARLKAKPRPAKRHVTIREVAKAAGASVSTISAALNNSDYVSAHMRSRIDEAIKTLRYSPNDLARSLRLQKTHSIAIVVPDLSNNFYIELVRGAKDYSASTSYTVLIGDSRESLEEERNYLDSFDRRRVDGIVRVPPINSGSEKGRPFLGNIPVVYADRYPPDGDSFVGRVGVDNTRAAESATGYLLSLGHRDIGIITGDASSGTSVERLQGFLSALRGAKIRSGPFDDSQRPQRHGEWPFPCHAASDEWQAPNRDFLHQQYDGHGRARCHSGNRVTVPRRHQPPRL